MVSSFLTLARSRYDFKRITAQEYIVIFFSVYNEEWWIVFITYVTGLQAYYTGLFNGESPSK